VENRNGLIAAAMVTQADGYAEREAALLMLEDMRKGRRRRITVGADKAYDTKDFIAATRALNVTAHVTRNEKGRRSNLDRRTTRHPATPSAEPPLADRKRIWVAQADRSDAPGEAARTAQGRLAVRLQLRSPQPDAAAQADRPKSGARPQAAVRLRFDRRAETTFHEHPKPA